MDENEIIKPILPEPGEKEIWKEHPIYTHYEVSTFGNVRVKKTGKLLNPRASVRGYHRVHLRQGIDNKNGKYVRVHRLVGETFYGLHPDLEIDHIDRNRINNYWKNIRWVTKQENCKNCKKTRRPKVFMNRPAIVLLSREDGKLIKEYKNLQEAVDELGLSPASIRDNIHGYRFPFKVGRFMLKSEYNAQKDEKN